MTSHRCNSPSLRIPMRGCPGSAPVFSIVLPTYNRPELLRRAISSVCRQTFRDFELIVVDDGSTMSCCSALPDPADARIQLIRNPSNIGVAGSRNVGIEAARGTYISFLDDDDEYRSSFLSSTYACLKNTPANIGLSWCSVEYIRYAKEPTATQRTEVREFPTKYPNTCKLLERFLTIGMGFGVTFKAGCLEKVGRFNPGLKVKSDTDFFFRVLSEGFVPIVVPGVHVVLHDHPMSRLTSPAMVREGIRVYEGFFGQYSELMDQYPPIRTNFLHFVASLKLRESDGRANEVLPVRAARDRRS
jgi:glycosyltransferase involved in cell wall biosynthesis